VFHVKDSLSLGAQRRGISAGCCSSQDSISKKLITKRGWKCGSSHKSDCLARVGPSVQTLELSKKEKKRKRKISSPTNNF
jgi:hypothetical protein